MGAVLTNARGLPSAQATHYQLLDLSTASCCMLGYHVCALTPSRRHHVGKQTGFRLQVGLTHGCQLPSKSKEEEADLTHETTKTL